METKEYIESGILELYVYGLLNESENEEVTLMANAHPEINAEIISIEKAIVNLSTSFSPFLSAENFEKIKNQLELKHRVIALKPSNNKLQYMGWAAAVLLFLGFGYQYSQLSSNQNQIAAIETEKSKLQEALVQSVITNKQSQDALSIVRDVNNTQVSLDGQAVAPKAYAKVYYNKETEVVYVDAAGLPNPPEGMVYQIWALKLNPLTPTSIGILENFTAENQKLFAVSNTNKAEAFGITLEPAGGSKTPTMEQLYTLGKV